MDVQVKSEYRGHWTGNMAAGGGYKGKWTGRAFMANLSDRLQVGLSGAMNNLNGDMKADANGNWTYSGYRSGWTTFRNTNLSLGWTNKDDKRAAGYQELNASFNFNHDNRDYRSYTRQENILPGQTKAWWYQRSRQNSMQQVLSGGANYSVNLDTLTFLTLSFNLNRSRDDADGVTRSATFHTNPTVRFPEALADPLQLLLSDPIPAEVQAILTNANYKPTEQFTTQHTYDASARLSRRFGKADMLNVNASWRRVSSRFRQFNFYDLRYYTSGQEQREPQRQHARQDNASDYVSASASYDKSVGKKEWLTLNYRLDYRHNDRLREYWNLERLAGWADLSTWPLTALPEGYRQMADLLLDSNSDDQLLRTLSHTGSLTFNSHREKWDIYLSGWVKAQHDRLDYARQVPMDTLLSQWTTTYGVNANLKWKFTEYTSLNLSGGYQIWEPDVSTRLSYTDTSNPESTVISNPNLKGGRTGNTSLSFNTFFEPQQLSLWADAYASFEQGATSRIMRYDNATGYYAYQNVNLHDLQYRAGGGGGMSVVLDQEKVWTFSYSPIQHEQ